MREIQGAYFYSEIARSNEGILALRQEVLTKNFKEGGMKAVLR